MAFNLNENDQQVAERMLRESYSGFIDPENTNSINDALGYASDNRPTLVKNRDAERNITDSMNKKWGQIPGAMDYLHRTSEATEDWLNNAPIGLDPQEYMQRTVAEGGYFYDPNTLVGSQQTIENLANKKLMQQGRLDSAWNYTVESGFGRALEEGAGELLDTFIGNGKKISKEEAEERAKMYGVDLKFDKDVSEATMWRRINKAITIQELNKNMQIYNSTGDMTFLQKAQLFGATVVAGAAGTPSDLLATGASIFAPELAVGALAKIGQTGSNVLKAKKALDAVGRINRYKAKAFAVENIRKAETLGAKAFSANRLKAGITPEKFNAKVSTSIKLAETLENMGALKYSNLTAREKWLADIFAFQAVDAPQAYYKKSRSEETGIDLYSEKDMVTELLLASSLGAFVPLAGRTVGGLFGMTPMELTLRRTSELKNKIKAQRASGTLSNIEAKKRLNTVDKYEKSLQDIQKSFKEPHPFLKGQADYIQRVNVDDNIIKRRLILTLSALASGDIKRLRDLPEWASIFSHIDARILEGLRKADASSIFGRNLIKEVNSAGVHSITVNGETGALSLRKVMALTERDAQEQLENIYRGYVLDDPEALMEFKVNTLALENFVENLKDINARWEEVRAHNLKARPEERITNVNLRSEIMDAFLEYRLGPAGLEQEREISKELFAANAFGSKPKVSHSPEFNAALKEARAFVAKWVKQVDGVKGAYNFIDAKGRANTTGFRKVIAAFEDMVESNKYLSNLDNVLEDMDVNRIKSFLTSVEKGEPTSDAELKMIFGTPATTFDELKKLDSDNVTWQKQYNISKIEYNTLMSETSPVKDAIKALSKNSTGIFSVNKDLIEEIDKIKATGFAELKENFLTAIKERKGLANSIVDQLNGKDKGRGIYLTFRDVLGASISDFSKNTGLKEYLSGNNLKKITMQITNNFMEEIKRNPKVLESLLSVENLKKVDEFAGEPIRVPEQTVTQQRLKGVAIPESESVTVPGYTNERALLKSAERTANTQAILTPLENALNIELTRLQLQAMNDMNIMVNTLQLMIENKEAAHEVLISAATQTKYVFKGSQRNIEYIQRSAASYNKRLIDDLRRLGGEERGQEYVDYFLNPDSQEAIQEAIVRQKFNIETKENSIADVIAKEMLRSEATLNSAFRQFGSSYYIPSNYIDRAKMRWADNAIPDTEIDGLYRAMNLDLDVEKGIPALVKRIETEIPAKAEGKYIFGDTEYFSIEDLQEALKATPEEIVKEIYTSMRSFFGISHKGYKKVALWIFRDADLDAMFNQSGDARVGFNRVRDALLSGDITSIFDGDFKTLKDTLSDVRFLESKLLGKERKKNNISTESWVYNYMSGFTNVAAVARGRRAAFLDAFESRIIFKDAASEISATQIFGYDNLQKAFQSNIESGLKARYILEKYGATPVSMVQNLIDIYNKEVVGTIKDPSVNINKYLITEGKEKDIIDFTEQACGLQNTAAGTVSRVINIIKTLSSVDLLAKAGFKSATDYATILEGLVRNAYVEGGLKGRFTQGIPTMTRAIEFMIKHPEEFRSFCAGNLIEQEALMQMLFNDPAFTLSQASSFGSKLELWESFSRKYADLVLNKVGQIANITNINKSVASWSIQDALGKASERSYSNLPTHLQYALEREGIDVVDWDMLRKHGITNINEQIGEEGKWLVFNPKQIRDISDKDIEKALTKKGKKNISQTAIESYREDLMSKAFVMVDASADEMVSLPSNRVMQMMRLGQVKGTARAALAEMITQYQSFGISYLMNSFGSLIANTVRGETGITMLDALNPFIKLNRANRSALYGSILATYLSIGVWQTIVDTVVDATTGRIETPVTEDGANWDLIRRRVTAPMGTAGLVVDAMWDSIDGKGQGAGGIALQVGPAMSNVGRSGYRVLRPLFSDRVENKAAGVSAAIVQELARKATLRNTPFISLIWQKYFGTYLDMQAYGGPEDWNRAIRERERRGIITMPWEENPSTLFDLFK